MQVLALDIGASNGRAIVGQFKAGKISLTEIYRFENQPVKLNQYWHWNFLALFGEVQKSLGIAFHKGYRIESVAIDTWGVDYGLLDRAGELMASPIHYRDERSKIGQERLLAVFDKQALKRQTGMEVLIFNTINQLLSDRLLKQSDCSMMLNMPDLFNYFLTGQIGSEYSMATTTQLYDYRQRDWNYDLIEQIKLPKRIFAPVFPSCRTVGLIKPEIANQLEIDPVKVISVTSHDTAAAVRSVPEASADFLFVATGTWAIVGAKQQKVTINDRIMASQLTNEGGDYPNVNLLKNQIGLWLLQECKAEWNKSGIEIDYPAMIEQAERAECASLIDLTDQSFFEPGDMPNKIKAYCRKSGQPEPKSIGEVVLVAERSIAHGISQALTELEEAVGKRYDRVYVFGGGLRDRLLLRLLGEVSGREMIQGVVEATAMGNVIDQLITLGGFTEAERISVIRNSLGE